MTTSNDNCPCCGTWLIAVEHIRAHYPESVFRPDSPSPDARAGSFARKTCDNIENYARALFEDETSTDG
jgi:hypothetical protein